MENELKTEISQLNNNLQASQVIFIFQIIVIQQHQLILKKFLA